MAQKQIPLDKFTRRKKFNIIKMKPKKDIFQIFQENQHKLNERPSPQAWRRLERRLDARRGQNRPSLYRHIAMAAGVFAIIALISLIAVLVDQNNGPSYLAINQPGPIQLEELTYTDVDVEALKVVEFTNGAVNRSNNIKEGNSNQLLMPAKVLTNNSSDNSQTLAQQLHWLLGDWEQSDNQKVSKERWSIIDDYTLEGKGSVVTEQGQQLFSETMTIKQAGQQIFLSISLRDGGAPTKYQLVKRSDNTAVFENQTVDFPQLIVFYKQAEDIFTTLYQNRQPLNMSNDQLNYLQQRNTFSSQYLRRDMEKVRVGI